MYLSPQTKNPSSVLSPIICLSKTISYLFSRFIVSIYSKSITGARYRLNRNKPYTDPTIKLIVAKP